MMVKALIVEALPHKKRFFVEVVEENNTTRLLDFNFNYHAGRLLAVEYMYGDRESLYADEYDDKRVHLLQLQNPKESIEVEVSQIITKLRQEYYIYIQNHGVIEISNFYNRLYLFYTDTNCESDAKEITAQELYDELLNALEKIGVIKLRRFSHEEK